MHEPTIYYKVLDEQGRAYHGGSGQWAEPGVWMPPIADPQLCLRGYHLCRREDLIYWLGPTIWTAEARGIVIEGDTKVVAERARRLVQLPWNQVVAVQFACDCAEQVLPVFERRFPTDDRPRRAIEAARRGEKGGAAGAAWAAWAAEAAAWAARAAGAAAWAAWAARAARAAGAAEAAAWAARAARAAGAAEQQWQTARLFRYLDQQVEA